jgi:alpha-glucosidase
MKHIVHFLILLLVLSCQPRKTELVLESPSKNLKAHVFLAEGKIFYQLFSNSGTIETPVIKPSPLGLVRGYGNFAENLTIEKIGGVKPVSDAYTMLTGKQKELAYQANEAFIMLRNPNGQRIEMIFRLFDEGLAFRYIFPGQSDELYSVESEVTGFAVTEGADAWIAPYQPATSWGDPGYEANYISVKAGDPSPNDVGWAFPLLFNDGDHWIFISEAGLDKNYCATHLYQNSPGGLYTISLPEANERYGDGEVEPVSTLPWVMPWRFILVGRSLNTIVESSMVHHLAEPSKIEDTSWIKPGRASWEWWSSRGGRTVKNLKHFVDLAADMGWEYSLVDAGWGNMPDGTIEEVIEYARERNVGLLFWYNSGGRRDEGFQNDDFVMFNDDSRDEEFARISALGIKGIKVDFFATDKQLAIKLYLDILRDAAKHKLVVNFHGNTLPRGWSRTWPNLLTLEAVRGAEAYRFAADYPDYSATYNTMAAAIRTVVGPSDFTPATFSNQRFPRKTTAAHEMALTIVYETGILHFADTPESYFSLPTEAIDFFKKVPVTWDETRLLAANPDELFVIVRRNGESWYIAGINGKNAAQEVTITLPETLKNPVLFADGPALNDLDIKAFEEGVNTISITMQPMGGFLLYNK